MELKCHNPECNWTWNYTGKKTYPAWVACPNCLRRVKLPKLPDKQADDMQLRILRPEDAIEVLQHRIHNGWVIIMGDTGLINQLEQHVYTPGSGKNKYFEILGFPHIVCIGKKTDDLKTLLGDPDDFDRIIAIVLHEHYQGTGVLTEVIFYRPGGKDSSIDELVKQATSRWSNAKH